MADIPDRAPAGTADLRNTLADRYDEVFADLGLDIGLDEQHRLAVRLANVAVDLFAKDLK